MYNINMADDRRKWIEILQKTSAQFDKTIMVLSSGAIALSVSFLKDIVCDRFEMKGVLFVSWISFGASLVCNLVSYLTSQLGYIENIKQIDDINYNPSPKWNQWTWGLNISSLTLFVVGVLLMLVFCASNVIARSEGGRIMSQNDSTNRRCLDTTKHKEYGMPVVPNKTVSIPMPKKIDKGMPVVPNKPIPKPAPKKISK